MIKLLCYYFMQGFYNYIPEKNHVSRVYSVAAVLYLLFVRHNNVILAVKYAYYYYYYTVTEVFLTVTEVFLTVTEVFLTVTEVFLTVAEGFLNMTEVFLTPTEVFPCFFLSCKANARVKLARRGTDRTLPHQFVFVLFGCYYLCCSVFICIVLCIICV
jgi:hypothetical protein